MTRKRCRCLRACVRSKTPFFFNVAFRFHFLLQRSLIPSLLAPRHDCSPPGDTGCASSAQCFTRARAHDVCSFSRALRLCVLHRRRGCRAHQWPPRCTTPRSCAVNWQIGRQRGVGEGCGHAQPRSRSDVSRNLSRDVNVAVAVGKGSPLRHRRQRLPGRHSDPQLPATSTDSPPACSQPARQPQGER